MNTVRVVINADWTLLHVIDTRCFNPETGKAEPGTGDQVECECCGRLIEIHATVERRQLRRDEFGRSQFDRPVGAVLETAIVGTQCAKRANVRSHVSPSNKNWWQTPNRFRKLVQA